MAQILTQSFFTRETLIVAEELLGKYLVREIGTKRVAWMITEVEAYDGPEDLASHARAGITERTRIMFGESGYIYVYLVYGMHNMLNIVTGPKDYPAAVLIRGIEGISGPGRICKALNITRELNSLTLGEKSGIWIEDRGERVRNNDITRTPRIGVAYAGEEWAHKPYRFVLNK